MVLDGMSYEIQSTHKQGTPVINTYNDLGSLVRFVGWTGGIEAPEVFNAKITRKLMNDGPNVRREAVKLIKALMMDFSLRRRKDMSFAGRKLVELPPMKEFCYTVEFETQEEIDAYEKLSKQAKGLLKAMPVNVGSANQPNSGSQVLEILLRMRQAACALDLISPSRLALLDQLDTLDTLSLDAESRLLLQGLLALSIEANEECPICMDAISDASKIPVVTYCKHVFCQDCIFNTLTSRKACPLCRSTLDHNQILEMPKETQVVVNDTRTPGTSSKINALIEILKSSNTRDSTTKTIVFSQWTKLLDLIEPQLEANDIQYCRIDGTMTSQQRDGAIKELANKPSCKVMLASLSVASVGLNLVMANQAVLMDPWWAPAIEDQAVDRIYRLGQERPVTLYKLVVAGTIEQKVLEIQARKRKMTATMGTGENRQQAAQTRRSDIALLLGG